jgi:hypothetical protein
MSQKMVNFIKSREKLKSYKFKSPAKDLIPNLEHAVSALLNYINLNMADILFVLGTVLSDTETNPLQFACKSIIVPFAESSCHSWEECRCE